MCIPPVVAGQRLACVSLHSVLGGGTVNTFPLQRIHATTEELLEASFSVRFMSCEMKVGDSFSPELLVHLFTLIRTGFL
jgi:hypothetical protein